MIKHLTASRKAGGSNPPRGTSKGRPGNLLLIGSSLENTMEQFDSALTHDNPMCQNRLNGANNHNKACTKL